MTYFVKTALWSEVTDHIKSENSKRTPGAITGNDLYDKIKAVSPVEVRESPDFTGAAFSPLIDPHIRMPSQPEYYQARAWNPAHILAHEVGHAQYGNTPLGGITQSLPVGLARSLSRISSPITGAAISGSGAHRGWHALGLGLNLLPSALGLVNEHMASRTGRGLLGQAGVTDFHQYDTDMGTAFKSYIPGLALNGITYGMGAGVGEIIRHFRSKGKSEAEQQLGLQPHQLQA